MVEVTILTKVAAASASLSFVMMICNLGTPFARDFILLRPTLHMRLIFLLLMPSNCLLNYFFPINLMLLSLQQIYKRQNKTLSVEYHKRCDWMEIVNVIIYLYSFSDELLRSIVPFHRFQYNCQRLWFLKYG